MEMRTGMKIRWKGEDGYLGLRQGEIYTFRKGRPEQRSLPGKCRLCEDFNEERFYPLDLFEVVEIRPGMKVRWRGESDWLMLTHGKEYTVLSVEREWYRVIDNSGEDYLYPPEGFDIVEDE